MNRLVYQAWQEQALLEALVAKLKRERALLEQKQNFVRLSSHYLRTPLTLITTGVELMSGQGASPALTSRLSQASQQLNLGVNGLLEQAAPQTTLAAAPPRPSLPNASLYLKGSLAGAFIVITSGVYLLNHLDLTDVKANSLLAEAVVILLAAVTIYSARRSRSARQLLRKHFEELLIEQRSLEKQRNDLVRGALDNLGKPLAEIKAGLQTVKGQPMAKAAAEGAGNFEAVLGKFIILSNLEAGAMATLKQPISLNQMTAKIAEHYRPVLEQKGLQIRTQLKADNLNQDPLLLEFVLDSVVNNAVQYSPQGGQIDIISRRDGAYTSIFVRDQGAGIPAEKLAVLFQPFGRAENVEEHFEHQGLGLSLYLDKLIMRYLGGGIRAESPSGQGTLIKLRLRA